MELTEIPVLTLPELPMLLPSERRFIQIIVDPTDCYMTSTVKQTGGQSTVVVLGLDHSSLRITDLRDALLKEFTREDILAADEFPWDYLYPYIRDALRDAVSVCQKKARDFRHSQKNAPLVFLGWTRVRSKNDALNSSLSSIRRLLATSTPVQGAQASRLHALIPDHVALIVESERIAQNLHGLLQSIQNTKVIEETARGLQQSDSLRRLTFVAFVFIPLNFTTSFFGMNIKQLGTGSLNIAYFFLLAVLAGGLAFILSGAIKPTEAAWKRARERFALREFGHNIDIDWIPKRLIIWDWFRRHFRVAQKLDDFYSDNNIELQTAENNWDPPASQVLKRCCTVIIRTSAQRFMNILPFRRQDVADSVTEITAETHGRNETPPTAAPQDQPSTA